MAQMEENEREISEKFNLMGDSFTEAVQKLEARHEEITKLKSLEDEMSQELQRVYSQVVRFKSRTRKRSFSSRFVRLHFRPISKTKFASSTPRCAAV